MDRSSMHQSNEVANAIEIPRGDSLITIDAITVDERSRFTLTKRIKRMIPVEPNDVVVFYKDNRNGKIILRIQHDNLY